MNVKWDIELKPHQVSNPVMYSTIVDLPADLLLPHENELRKIFVTEKQSLKTWGRTSGELNGTEPHWIGVHKQTPLHVDPAYPRYTHHLLLKVDGFCLRGVDKVETPLVRGTYAQIDTHSPHQLYAKTDTALWYLAVSMDSKTPLSKGYVIPNLIRYALNNPLLTDEILQPNNGGRF